MNISVDDGLKKKIQIENRKHRRGIHNLWIFEKFIFVIVLVLVVMFPIYCKITGSFISTNMRTGQNSYFIVAMFTSIIAGMGLVFVLLVSVLRKRVENILIGGRVDETIKILDDKLFYTFRIKYQSHIDQWNLVVIDINKIKNISYDDILFEICIEGMILEKIVDVSHDENKIKTDEFADGKIKIWDYFTPSLYELLISKHMYVQKY